MKVSMIIPDIIRELSKFYKICTMDLLINENFHILVKNQKFKKEMQRQKQSLIEEIGEPIN